MSIKTETFLTSNRRDYKWPYPKPIVGKPSQPPLRTEINNKYVSLLVEPYCHCDAHLYEPEMGRYKKLAQKEQNLYDELEELSQKMAKLSSDILDHPCDDDDEKMETLYQIHYSKKSLPVTQYRKLQAAIDSPVGVPTKGEIFGLGDKYLDPTKFRRSTFPKPFVDVCTPVTYERTPGPLDLWFAKVTGTSEYNDNFSNLGIKILQSSQQYKEPLPSTRRRADDDRC